MPKYLVISAEGFEKTTEEKGQLKEYLRQQRVTIVCGDAKEMDAFFTDNVSHTCCATNPKETFDFSSTIQKLKLDGTIECDRNNSCILGYVLKYDRKRQVYDRYPFTAEKTSRNVDAYYQDCFSALKATLKDLQENIQMDQVVEEEQQTVIHTNNKEKIHWTDFLWAVHLGVFTTLGVMLALFVIAPPFGFSLFYWVFSCALISMAVGYCAVLPVTNCLVKACCYSNHPTQGPAYNVVDDDEMEISHPVPSRSFFAPTSDQSESWTVRQCCAQIFSCVREDIDRETERTPDSNGFSINS